jgi:hypothetical protein
MVDEMSSAVAAAAASSERVGGSGDFCGVLGDVAADPPRVGDAGIGAVTGEKKSTWA